jgi:hypothetical protein
MPSDEKAQTDHNRVMIYETLIDIGEKIFARQPRKRNLFVVSEQEF